MSRERDLYPGVQRWLSTDYGCTETVVDKGFAYGRIDVCGLRHVGGELRGDVDFVAIEVKPTLGSFGTSAGQAAGYSVYADRCYLAAVCGLDGFSPDMIAIADHQGIGLIELRRAGRGAKVVQERLSAPKRTPIPRLRMQYLDKIGFCECSICRTVFRRGDHRKESWGANVTRQDLRKALDHEKGYIWWLRAAAEAGGRLRDQKPWDRRYLCPDCVGGLFIEPME